MKYNRREEFLKLYQSGEWRTGVMCSEEENKLEDAYMWYCYGCMHESFFTNYIDAVEITIKAIYDN